METPKTPTPIEHRIREGLSRLDSVLRSEDWVRARAAGLNPTQHAILEYLAGRAEGAAVRDIAFQLGVSQPTATESIAALERKSLVVKHASNVDKRAVDVCLTEAGGAALVTGDPVPGVLEQAAGALSDSDKEHLLMTLVTMIKRLQDVGAIPIQRMCVSCRHFRPYAHANAAKPHHCAFVNAAFGQRDVRIECRDHSTADPSLQAATWGVFHNG
ncbi:MarR family winged helix-turn-helix transcriptional regulator [Azospirillum sp. HJ39]|uniref:MarR family winged helix-turn-helix transcriptional regulator n=1 Tax=Azospirillum sp. HJ39 TaxID=3159496 RepID=UPI0035562F5A